MLKYLIQVTQDFLTTSILVGILYAYLGLTYKNEGRKAARITLVAGLIISAIFSVYKHTVYHVDALKWNLFFLSLSLVFLILFFIFSFAKIEEKNKKRIYFIASGGLLITWLLYALPDVYAYPSNFDLAGSSIFSTDFLYRFIGWAIGLLLVGLIALFVNLTAKNMDVPTVRKILYALMIVNALRQMAVCLRIMLSKRMIASNNFLFSIMTVTYNHDAFFIYAAVIIAAILPILLCIRSFHVNEPYNNPAQKRRIKAIWRRRRRFSVTMLLCFVIGTLNLTVVKSLDEREVELSPSEECEIQGDNVAVSLEQVADGHLHRFTYTDDNGVGIRFIVIQKPNSSAYGVGLDACDICGETGYFERNGQVVCKLCDVVMNINTIGLPGGCNPIPVDYSVENGYIVLPIVGLEEHANEFK